MLDAVFCLDSRFRAGGCIAMQDLVAELEVSQRTVERYIEFMRDRLEAPVAWDPDQGGYRYTDDRFLVPAVSLTDDELVALFVAQPILRRYRGTPLYARLRTAFGKMTRYLPQRAVDALDVLPSIVGSPEDGVLPDAGSACRFDALIHAAWSRKRVVMRYWVPSRNEVTERRFDPYGLRPVGETWYVAGFCHLRTTIQTFAVDRVLDVCATGESFRRPRDFDLDGYFADSLGAFRDPSPTGAGAICHDVRLRVDAVAERHFRERPIHSSQAIEPLPDGSFEVRLRVTGMPEIERLVLGWGEHVEVIEPAELRRSLLRRLREAAKAYGKRGRGSDRK